MEFSYWNGSKIWWMKQQFCRILWMELQVLFSYKVFSKLNKTKPRYFTLVLIFKWNFLSIVQRIFVIFFATCSLLFLLSAYLEHVHDISKWSMVTVDVFQNSIRLLLNRSYFVFLFLFSAGIGLLCNLEFDIFSEEYELCSWLRLIKLASLKILLLVTLLARWN